VKALKAEAERRVGVAGNHGFLLDLGLARMAIGLRIEIIPAEESLHGTVIAAGMACWVAGRKGVMNVSLESKSLPANGVDDRMAVAA
jgi:hypothetical protein